MKRILVTGATGFLARHLLPALERTNEWSVATAASAREAPAWLDVTRYHTVDIGSQREVAELVRAVAPDALIHAAAKVRGSAAQLCRTNLVGAANVLAAVREHSPGCRIICIGSAAEYGAIDEADLPITEDSTCEPKDAYGVTKLGATELALEAARSWGARVTVVRPFNMLGAHMPPYLVGGALLERVHAAIGAVPQRPIRVGRTDTKRDFVAVEDVVDGLTRLLARDESGEIYNLASGKPTEIAVLLSTLIEISGTPLTAETDPTLVRATDVATSYGNSDKARARCGFTATIPLEQALRAAWYARCGITPS